MPEQTNTLHVTGNAWLADVITPEELSCGEWQFEGEDGRVEIERTDTDEVAIHFILDGQDQAVFSFYTNRLGALALAGLFQMEAAR